MMKRRVCTVLYLWLSMSSTWGISPCPQHEEYIDATSLMESFHCKLYMPFKVLFDLMVRVSHFVWNGTLWIKYMLLIYIDAIVANRDHITQQVIHASSSLVGSDDPCLAFWCETLWISYCYHDNLYELKETFSIVDSVWYRNTTIKPFTYREWWYKPCMVSITVMFVP